MRSVKVHSGSSVKLPLFKLTCFLIAGIAASAQNNTDTAKQQSYLPYLPFKGTFHLINHKEVTGVFDVIDMSDSCLLVLVGGDNLYTSISIREIRSVRVKRNAVLKGLGYGAGAGLLIGYGIGYFSYTEDPYNEDPDEKEKRGFAGAILGVVPGAIVGGVIGGIFTRRHFKIAGDRENLLKMLEAVRRSQKSTQ